MHIDRWANTGFPNIIVRKVILRAGEHVFIIGVYVPTKTNENQEERNETRVMLDNILKTLF